MHNNLLLLEKFKNPKEGKTNSCVCKFSNVCFITSIFLQKVDLPLFSVLNCQTILLHNRSQIYSLSFQSIEKRIAFFLARSNQEEKKKKYISQFFSLAALVSLSLSLKLVFLSEVEPLSHGVFLSWMTFYQHHPMIQYFFIIF